jgi:uncharacterized damage-inducible protein DinB
MIPDALSLFSVYDGWDGYQTSLVHAIAPLSREQLRWRPASHLRSVGVLASHIGIGRLEWFYRMRAPGSAELAAQVAAIESPDAIAESSTELVRWLEATWQMVEKTLKSWTVADLARTYPHTYQGKTYVISRQWTIWRIMTHDIHHGGELALMLGMQGIALPELGDLGGHLTAPPLAEPS